MCFMHCRIYNARILIAHCSLLIALSLALPAAAQVSDVKVIPADSLYMLQSTFARTTELLWEKSDVFFHKGEFERCIAMLRIITEMDPSDTEAFAVGAWLMDSVDREGEAQAFLEKGLAQNQERYDLYDELGMFCFRKNDFDKSAEYYEKAVSFEDCPVITWHALAHAYEQGGQIDKAIKTWEHISVLELDNPVVKLNLDRLKEIESSKDSR